MKIIIRPKNETAFELALAANIRATIIAAKADGTTGMGLDSLMQATRPPSHSLAGAPTGTNARYYYREMFTQKARIIAGRFVIGGVK